MKAILTFRALIDGRIIPSHLHLSPAAGYWPAFGGGALYDTDLCGFIQESSSIFGMVVSISLI